MSFWPTISPGAIIDIVAPSGRFDVSVLPSIQAFLQAQGWIARLSPAMLGPHDFLANSDVQRLSLLQQALTAEDSDIIWCVRGGHGTTRIMHDLLVQPKPSRPKLLVGFSDITTLHLGLNQCWQWPSLHAPMARQVALGLSDVRDVSALLHLWQIGLANYTLTDLTPKNISATNVTALHGVTVGTCLSLLQTSLSTPWQIEAQDKILFIEDLNEPAYRLDRLLVHLSNAGIWQQATAIVLGDFATEATAQEQVMIARVLSEFSSAQAVPVFALNGFGHGARNQPIPLGVPATLQSMAESWQVTF